MACLIRKYKKERKKLASPYWYVKYRDGDGIIKEESTGTRNKAAATRIRNTIEDRLALDRFALVSTTSDVTVSEWCVEFYKNQKTFGTIKPNKESTIRRLHETIDPFIEAHQHIKLMKQFSPIILRGYVSGISGTSGNHAIYNTLKNLKVFFNSCEKLHHIPSPTKGIPNSKPKRTEPNLYTEDEILKMLAVKDSRVRGILLTALQTGARKREEANSRWKDIDFDRNKVWVRLREDFSPKDDSNRDVPLKAALRDALTEWRKITKYNKEGDLLFPNAKGKSYGKKFDVPMGKILKKLGIKGHCKKFRDTFASYSLACGVPLQTLRDWMGHSEVGTTDFYAKHLPRIQSAEVRALFEWKG